MKKIRAYPIVLETECEVTYRYGNQSRVIEGEIIAYYQTDDEYIRFKRMKDHRILIISLSHMVDVKYRGENDVVSVD